MRVRQATEADVDGMCAVLAPILKRWGSERRSDPAHVRAHYVTNPDRLSCAVALDDAGTVVGFQSLKLARAGNVYDVPAGWGIIGTYVADTTTGQGIGRALFAESRKHAISYGLRSIDATIGAQNTGAQAFYAAMGFVRYRELPGAIGARCDL